MQADTDCQKIQQLLPDFSTDGLGHEETKQVQAHLGCCAACSTELNKLDAVVQLIEHNGAMEPPSGLWNGVYNRITARESNVQSRPRVFGRRLRLATLALMAGAVMLAAFVSTPRHPQPAPMPSSVAAEYVEGYAIGASSGMFADRFSLASVAAMAGSEQQ